MKKKAVDAKTIETLKTSWNETCRDLFVANRDVRVSQERKRVLLDQLDAMLKVFDVLGGRPEGLRIPPELQFKPDITIGDAMEKVLAERGALPKKELIEILTQGQVIKNPKNSRILIANAITRDGRKRFKVTEDGKVALVKEGR